MNVNYQKWLEDVIEKNQASKIVPSLLLHCCCAPCASYVLEYLSRYFNITAYFYNPNIFTYEEFILRANELKRLISSIPTKNPINLIVEEYDSKIFLKMAQGNEYMPEGDLRCFECYRLRLEKTAIAACSNGFDYFSTTLSVSPHKNANWLNEIGKILTDKYKIQYLHSDFKKKNGYKRSCELSVQYELYRQSFCGCKFSKIETEKREIIN